MFPGQRRCSSRCRSPLTRSSGVRTRRSRSPNSFSVCAPSWCLSRCRQVKQSLYNVRAPQTFDDGQLDWWLDGDCSSRDRLRAVGRQLRTAVFPATDPKPAAIVVPREQLRATASQAKAPACYRGLYSAPATAPVGTATFVRADTSTRQWSVKTEEPALLVLGELYLPGWEATVTAQQAASTPNDASRVALARASDYWQAIPVDRAGEYSVVLEYRVPGLGIGIACSLLASLAWIGLAGLCWWCR